ncbi:MAG: O-methyltransferase [Lachnospiraceae bacterium]|nr:O-methyltransferase [Lachnospiraceae bacterium]
MIVNELITGYLASLAHDLPPALERLKSLARKEQVPIVRDDMLEFIRFLLLKEKPKTILEIGTAVGFSALFMQSVVPGAHITTIEKVEKRLKVARKNLEGSGIKLIEGDACEVLGKLEGFYDMIFLDAAKGQYGNFLPDCKRLLTLGGIMLTDNVLLEGSIAGSRFGVERRDRTIHERMREFLRELTHTEGYVTVIIPVGDGAALTYKETGN